MPEISIPNRKIIRTEYTFFRQTENMKTNTLPELLAPAGSPEALNAAIAAGADAVYFGGDRHNARIHARNFAGDALREAIARCRHHGVKTNITLNTLAYDREIDDILRYTEQLYHYGADALIVADFGLASLIARYFPAMPLHASTQAAGHNLDGARELASMGFSRMVAAREVPMADLQILCRESPIEIEMFVHGALCVSQSGQCLASSLIGGRSGNRGACAQPCRLPYGCGKKCDTYALSLKDLCLAEHITDILPLGAASLKIEGRMKGADYVYGVTRIYRRLLDERRNASAGELAELRALFSRSGFTDGYFTGHIDSGMLGVRTDSEKSRTAAARAVPVDYAKQIGAGEAKKLLPVVMTAEIRAGQPTRLRLALADEREAVTVNGPVPEEARSCPLTRESVENSLCRLGGTPFVLDGLELTLEDGLMLPVSAMKALRREAVEALTARIPKEEEKRPPAGLPDRLSAPESSMPVPERTARMARLPIPEEALSFFDRIYLPLEKIDFSRLPPEMDKLGVILPPVIFDSERSRIGAMLKEAAASGITHALVSNIGHIAPAREYGMVPHGDFRFNVTNRYTADVLMKQGLADLIASPELTLPMLRDLHLPPVLYGRIPLMTLEKCVIRDQFGCQTCEKAEKSGRMLVLKDRKGASFPLARTFDHRNLMYNSVPVYMADRPGELRAYRIAGGHFIFSDESAAQIAAVIRAHENQIPPDFPVRRIAK